MRLIDADALKELFSEVIGHIAIKPEMNGNLEHMVRASAMVIQMIDDAPTVQPDTTTHDSNVVKKGGNDEDRTTDDYISRQAAIDAICTEGTRLERNGTVAMVEIKQWCIGILEALPSAQPKRKTGHWIKTARWGRVYYCDQCRNYLDFDGVNAGRGSTNFCPNCGADMRGEQE